MEEGRFVSQSWGTETDGRKQYVGGSGNGSSIIGAHDAHGPYAAGYTRLHGFLPDDAPFCSSCAQLSRYCRALLVGSGYAVCQALAQLMVHLRGLVALRGSVPREQMSCKL